MILVNNKKKLQMQLLTICKYFKFGGPNQFQLQLLDKSPASSLLLIYVYFQLDISSFSAFPASQLLLSSLHFNYNIIYSVSQMFKSQVPHFSEIAF